jgi:hypothetical protein
MSRPANGAASEPSVPEAESPTARTGEQEAAGGRTASTPVTVLLGVILAVGCLVALVLALVIVAYVTA